MQVFAIVLVLAVAGANANLFSDELAKIKATFSVYVDAIKDTVKDLLPAVVDQGKTLLTHALKDSVAEIEKTIFGSLVHAIHNRDLSEVLEKGETLKNHLVTLVHAGQEQFNKIIEETAAEMSNIHDKISNLIVHPELGIHLLEQLLVKHTSLSKDFLENLEQDANLLVSVFSGNKRGFASNIGQKLADLFKPQIDSITGVFASTKDYISTLAANLKLRLSSVMHDLREEMAVHVKKMIVKGIDATTAMKDAATDILNQTKEDAKPVVQQMIDSLIKAGSHALLAGMTQPAV